MKLRKVLMFLPFMVWVAGMYFTDVQFGPDGKIVWNDRAEKKEKKGWWVDYV
jgi:hypothetical protein